jgi:hypothetical protein
MIRAVAAGGGGHGLDWARRLKRSLPLGELLWRFFGKDLGEFGNNDDVTYIQLYLQKGLERRIHSS